MAAMVHVRKHSDTSRRLRAGFFPLLLPALAAAVLLACAASGLGDDNQRPPRRVLQRAAPSWDNDWSRGAVFYEVFVRSFADSNGDGIGDLKGLTAKLDYLNDGDPDSTADLGVDALWLMPVFASPSYHGYDTTDYEHINPEYGTDEDFADSVHEAHRRGIRVILDFVVNHSGSGHPWFIDASSGPTAARRNWYVWSPVDLGLAPAVELYSGSDTWHQNAATASSSTASSGRDARPQLPQPRGAGRDRAPGHAVARPRGRRVPARRGPPPGRERGRARRRSTQPETHAFWREFAAHVRTGEARGDTGRRGVDRHADHRHATTARPRRSRAATSCR